LAIAAFLVAPCIFAGQQVSRSFEVRAEVIPNCRLTLEPLVFGSYDPLVAHANTALDATSMMVVTCTRDTHATIMIDQGQNASVGTSNRVLVSSDQRLQYQLYRDSARTEVWGTGSNAFDFISPGVSGSPLTIFARIPAGQSVAAGVYNDLVTATVDF
jgi:spore coat protein U-like protein